MKKGPPVGGPFPFITSISRVPAPAEAEAVEAAVEAADRYPLPGSPSRPRRSASPEAEVEAAVEAEAAAVQLPTGPTCHAA